MLSISKFIFEKMCSYLLGDSQSIFYDKKRVVGNVLGRVSALFLVHREFYFLNQSPFSLKV